MRIIGIDPGTVITGIGIIDTSGSGATIVDFDAVTSFKGLKLPDRLKKIYDTCTEKIIKYKPQEFAIETAFYGKNVQSLLKLGQARGVAIIAALNQNIPVSEYSPREIKKSITGNGASTKSTVSSVVKSILSIKTELDTHDISDALAVALCHSFKRSDHLNMLVSEKSKVSWSDFILSNPDKIFNRN
ncbi:crossover junction endodeoxyribonuclease RuvC [Ignavibacteria bacterium CHB1]|nr:MAG: crossover junction endodeoxyribonuclease RuvC [Chlorobiota bacterium]MBV6399106.1 Crossover junction endodeoxyribonuclease RuvC [Ignavibacteria bacterium]MCC6885324.1 crossover junction endodeoxyribonuclease RuvC [Ignavibacteriales bacterium]MCE7953273.1 crossover junction endodeoxyribonuclease RuvC [Chlorobi bacterium CHB7]MDL1887309.1 crossover junction endodeoxyribonuclease RuvC [Ignavibacteria bacterium CHB1]RIK48389.1 MAG: crossover junction endodeoxyribonuclease RuvC [Ignavibacte